MKSINVIKIKNNNTVVEFSLNNSTYCNLNIIHPTNLNENILTSELNPEKLWTKLLAMDNITIQSSYGKYEN